MTPMRVILPKAGFLDPARYLRAVENALDGAARGAQVDFEATVETWKEKPEFRIEARPFYRLISTDNEIYGYVNHGTRVRRAVMTRDFFPKTRHRALRSNKGKGGVVFIGKKINQPGIEAREFDKAVKEKWDGELPRTLQRAIDAEAGR